VNDGRDDGAFVRVLTIVNQRGLHARAAAKFARCAEGFDAEVTVSRQDTTVTATSIMGLMLLAATQGSCIEVRARGPEAAAAMEALATLVAGRFHEE